MKITIVGTGYVGLVSGTCFAETGIIVNCVDIDSDKIDKLNRGLVPIYEPGLEDMISTNVEKKRLFFSTNLEKSLLDCDAAFIAVGTPPDEDGSADLRHVLSVARDIGRYMKDYLVVVNKSTVPIGTAVKVRAAVKEGMQEQGLDIEFDVASNPEFLKEGAAISDFLKPDRIVVGVDSERAEKIMQRLYKAFLLNGHPLLFMDVPSAEMTKYAANAMLATKISFMNDIANLCEIVGADVNNVRKGIGSDTRIGNKFIYPGAGYGGSCFPKDVKALIRTSDENQYSLEILKAVERVNNNQKLVIPAKIRQHFGTNLKGKRFAVWGLSFKPKTDDMREAPSLVIIEELLKEGASISAYDPVAAEEARHRLGDRIDYAKDMYEALIDATALIVVTEWPEFRVPNYKVMERLMAENTIFDGRNIYEPSEMLEFGFTYYSIGRKTLKP
ncbi:MAG TPA: UDP-glucose/GDP-mannose dehydrogenase family protein [Bacteroidales bacterium]|nr:UDP-glucose/GDP-mannose dehydrogenase family protein [Bacteroidales bacterium]